MASLALNLNASTASFEPGNDDQHNTLCLSPPNPPLSSISFGSITSCNALPLPEPCLLPPNGLPCQILQDPAKV